MRVSPEVWLARLKNKDENTHHEAKRFLGGLTPSDREYVPGLTQALKSDDSEFRFWAATALACIRSEARDAVPELIALLQDEVFGNRQSAAHALGCIGPAANPAVPELVKALSGDRNMLVRQEIVRALGGIGTPEAITALIGALADPDQDVRRYAVISLKMLGSEAKEAIPALKQIMMSEKDQGIRDQVEAALKLMGAK